jgi:hypothetical protein
VHGPDRVLRVRARVRHGDGDGFPATNAQGFRFQTDPAAPTKSVFAQLGKVMNGVFAD